MQWKRIKKKGARKELKKLIISSSCKKSEQRKKYVKKWKIFKAENAFKN
jgi:hypothetical protein